MRLRSPIASQILLAGLVAGMAIAVEPKDQSLERRFQEVVRPFLKDQCLACHGPRSRRASWT